MNLPNLVDENVPEDVQRAIVQIVNAVYAQTRHEVFKRYGRPEAIDVEPHIRRANIESAFVEIGDRFSDSVRIGSRETTKGHHFRYLVCGRLLLTQSYTEGNRRVPREAQFRNGFAGDPNQSLMFSEEEAERLQKLKDLNLIYVILTHSPSVRNRHEPSHITITLVDSECKFVSDLNLIEHLELRTSKQVREEVVEDQRKVKLRKDVTHRKNTGA